MKQAPRFPKGPGSIRAQVLAVLLSSRDMTGCESIFAHRKVALATVIRALTRKYNWPVEREEFPTNTPDGRAGWATVYCLPHAVIEAAFADGAQDWLDGVEAARAAKSRPKAGATLRRA